MKRKTRNILAVLTVIITAVSLTAGSAGFLFKDTVQIAEQLAEEFTGSDSLTEMVEESGASIGDVAGFSEIPEYDGNAYITVNGNKPQFDVSLKKTESFENYGSLDKHGRCTKAIASLSVDTQPQGGETRGDISSVHPSGWKSGMGWERCHLIGWQLSGENANAKNLVTGTHYMNVSGMLPFENRVDWYISETGNHVLYEVEPVFEGKNMVCSGVHMQAESVEDNGNGISFNVYCFNVSPGKNIDYKTGEVYTVDEQPAAENSFERVYVLNKNSMKFHYPSCSSVAQMAEHNKEVVTDSREKLIYRGYSPCGNCEP